MPVNPPLQTAGSTGAKFTPFRVLNAIDANIDMLSVIKP